MALAQAMHRREIGANKLRKTTLDLSAILENMTERIPTEAALKRKMTAAATAWREFEEVHASYTFLLEEEEQYNDEQNNYYDAKYDMYENVVARAEERVEAMTEPTDDPRDRKLRGALLTQEAELVTMNTTTAALLKTLDTPDLQVNEVSLDMLEEELGGVRRRAEEVISLSDLILTLDDGRTDEQREIRRKVATEQTEKELQIRTKITNCRRPSPPASLGHVSSGRSSSDGDGERQQNYFEKRPFPKFSGEKREYPSFRKEWKQCIAPSFQSEFQLREIRRAIPKHVEPDIKNLKTMDQVWTFLDDEFGQPMEISSELVDSLTNFKFSSGAKTEGQKFVELRRKWNEVYADLEEIDRVGVLDHEPTLNKICQRLPSQASQTKYVEWKIEWSEQRFTELEIMSKFMVKEGQRQRALQRMGTKVGGSESSARESSARESTAREREWMCYRCGGKGHKQDTCPLKVGVVNASMKGPQKPCPVCDEQHCYTNPEGEKMYMSRLSACATFSNMGAGERAAVVQKAQGCSTCLDWTGEHDKDSCRAKKRGKEWPLCDFFVDGRECGSSHHKMLHGTTNRYCNLVQINAVKNMAPTRGELNQFESAQNILMQVQNITINNNKEQLSLLVFWDSGSNMNLVRMRFARSLGLTGRPVRQYLQTTGRGPEAWDTMVYWITLTDNTGGQHRILAFGMESITAVQRGVDVDSAVKLFPELRDGDQIRRPTGEVDLLVGIQHANLHPAPRGPKGVVGSLRLLESKFGTGYLLDGTHPQIEPEPMFLNAEALAKSHSTVGELKYEGQVSPRIGKGARGSQMRGSHSIVGETRYQDSLQPREINKIQKIRSQFNFVECEEMAVGQPRRCGGCSSCKKCSVRAQEMSRRDQEELALIEENIVVN